MQTCVEDRLGDDYLVNDSPEDAPLSQAALGAVEINLDDGSSEGEEQAVIAAEESSGDAESAMNGARASALARFSDGRRASVSYEVAGPVATRAEGEQRAPRDIDSARA